MSTTARRPDRSPHVPDVPASLCRHIRAKGLYTGGQPAGWDPHALPFDATVWWCAETEKQLGPDDRPCHARRCRQGRECYVAADLR